MLDPASASAVDFNFGLAWIVFTLAVALHVADEASHDFLAIYNPNALAIRRRFHVPMPVFTDRIWITSLAMGISALLLLTPLAFDGVGWLRIAAVPLAILAGIVNGLIHIAGSLRYRRPVAGILTAPLLLLTGAWLFLSSIPR
jgi:hypothetical protein